MKLDTLRSSRYDLYTTGEDDLEPVRITVFLYRASER
jgi:hypothetical protein